MDSCLVPGCGRGARGARTKAFCAHHYATIDRSTRLMMATWWRRQRRHSQRPVNLDEVANGH